MNFDDAIKAHAVWKMKLTGYINKPDKSLNSAEVSSDNKCELGKWLHSSESATYATHTEFGMLKQAHADFHKEAGSIIQRADKGESMGAEVSLGSGSNYAKASSAVVSHCMALKNMAK